MSNVDMITSLPIPKENIIEIPTEIEERLIVLI